MGLNVRTCGTRPDTFVFNKSDGPDLAGSL